MDLQVNSSNVTNLPRNLNQMKVAYAVSERQGRSYWTRVGVGFVNRDGSINVRLEAIPVSGNLQLRDWTPRDSAPEPEARTAAVGAESVGHTADIPF
ncbi:MAG TPA: hypothetical protein VNO21_18445 [Polyangiaceae bacterium]|nr:hypothetical protein [Polyangiaceae bacterium]